jgi:hypothetical protein
MPSNVRVFEQLMYLNTAIGVVLGFVQDRDMSLSGLGMTIVVALQVVLTLVIVLFIWRLFVSMI